ncbi:MAG TPA: hypothetical protein VG713_03480 [Pirellulales bacterium]|nr:hypothetical protein [Pirellulales bacterium]
MPQRIEGLTAEQIQALEEAKISTGETSEDVINSLLESRRTQIFLSVLPRNNQIVVRTADTQSMANIRDLIARLDVPTPLVLLEVKVLVLTLGDTFTSIFDYQFDDGVLDAGGFTTGNVLPPAADATGLTRDSILAASVAPGVPNLTPNQNATFQIVSKNFRARLQLLETKNRVTALASPLLLTANNEASRIFIGQQIPIVVGYGQSGVTGGTALGTTTAIQPAPQTQLENIGEGLVITPNINADRTVTLRISQQNSTTASGATIPVVTATGSTLILPITTVQSSVVSSTIVAKDGLTVALGGLIQETLNDTRSQVPVIGKLPVVGIMFRNQGTGKSRSETIVMIRPYIFNTPQESASLNADLVRDLSVHPKAPLAYGTMSSFGPQEVLTADPPHNPLQTIFRFHSIEPKVY